MSDTDQLDSIVEKVGQRLQPWTATDADALRSALREVEPDEWRWTCGCIFTYTEREPCPKCGQEPERWVRVA